MAKIILISDCHYSASAHRDVYDVEKINKKLTDSLSDNIFELLLSALEGEKEPADILVFCGDYIAGESTLEDKKKSMCSFMEFLDKIERSNKVLKAVDKKNHIVIVPGNHDIARGQDGIYCEFRNNLSRYLTPFSDTRDFRTAPTFIFDDLKLIIDCEATDDNSSTTNKKIEQWIEKINASDATTAQKNELTQELIKEINLDIPSVPAEMQRRFVDNSRKFLDSKKYSEYLKMVVTHHPLISGIESGKTIKNYNYTIGGFNFMRTAMEFDYKLFVHGHIHEKTCIEITDYYHENPHSAIQLGIPNLIQDRDENGVVVIDTDKSNGKSWPFSIVYKKLSTYTRSFKQTAVLDGRKKEREEWAGDMTILVDREIIEIIDEGRIIKNGDRDRVEAASYDCALGYEYKKSSSQYCNWDEVKKIPLEKDADIAEIIIEPHEAVLIYTYEEFDVPKDMVMHASPISSWLRKGLNVEISYFVDPGFQGQFCFPVLNESERPIHISSREPIMSIELVRLPQPCDKSWTERHQDLSEKRKNKED